MALKDKYEMFELEGEEAIEWYKQEIASLRTGRVTTELIAHINVEHYGAKTPLNGLASVTNSDARTLVVSAWDKGAVPAIEKALTEAQLGVMPAVDGEIIRLVFPSLTQEAREQTVKQLHNKTEEARVRLRQARDEMLKEIKDEKEKGDLTEDDFYEGKKKLDEMIDDMNHKLEEAAKAKEGDIVTV